ncbi:RNA polymerase sigma factor [Streptomyces sp. NPDC049879]|uniref:RNA polymerase sigma factor n=1 Tax=Streptomyces sp. NPDC049879 TaxID=3365598 RepID=UPI00379B12DF
MSVFTDDPPRADPATAAPPDPTPTPGPDPTQAFDALHAAHATTLSRQAYLLTGCGMLADRAVGWAFRRAWERWPEVAGRSDPGGWVRAAAYDYALSPWHTFSPGHRRRTAEVAAGVLTAMVSLPPAYRRVVLLHDVMGLDIVRTALEAEATIGATERRAAHARELLAARLPALAEAAPEERRDVLKDLMARALAGHDPQTPTAESVRRAGERATRHRTLAGLGGTAVTAGALVAAALLN